MPEPVSVRDRVRAVEALEAMAWEANRIAAWMSLTGAETESDMAEAAAVRLLACAHMFERPIRARLPPERWRDGSVNGHRMG